jgi:hypothetical protein
VADPGAAELVEKDMGFLLPKEAADSCDIARMAAARAPAQIARGIRTMAAEASDTTGEI